MRTSTRPLLNFRPMTSLAAFLAACLVPLLAPDAHADGLLYADRLAVYDSTGTQVGSAWPMSEVVWKGFPGHGVVVEFRVESTPVIVRLRKPWSPPAGFQPVPVRFSSPGCRGSALLDANEEDMTPFTAVTGPRNTVYIQSGPVRQRTARSIRSWDGVCEDTVPLTWEMALMSATRTHLNDYFVPPFTIRTRGTTPVPRRAP